MLLAESLVESPYLFAAAENPYCLLQRAPYCLLACLNLPMDCLEALASVALSSAPAAAPPTAPTTAASVQESFTSTAASVQESFTAAQRDYALKLDNFRALANQRTALARSLAAAESQYSRASSDLQALDSRVADTRASVSVLKDSAERLRQCFATAVDQATTALEETQAALGAVQRLQELLAQPPTPKARKVAPRTVAPLAFAGGGGEPCAPAPPPPTPPTSVRLSGRKRGRGE